METPDIIPPSPSGVFLMNDAKNGPSSTFAYYCRVCSVQLEPELMAKGLCSKHANEAEKREKMKRMWSLMAEAAEADSTTIQERIAKHSYFTLGRTRFNFDKSVAYQATALSLRDSLIYRWNETQQFFTSAGVKRVYYLSLEFLLGRNMQNAIHNMGLLKGYKEGLKALGVALEELYSEELDPALGNGGLGRLAACFMDSIASCNFPGWGYGLFYSYGMFHQKVVDGYQVEVPDYWLLNGNPWEIKRTDVAYQVGFYGEVAAFEDSKTGEKRCKWRPAQKCMAVAHDIPIPGFNTFNTCNIRLWDSRPTRSSEFDLSSFNSGNYYGAIEDKQQSETISSVLYPNDSTYEGKILRLKQQYFFCCATLKDIVRRFKKTGKPLKEIPTMVAIQLNDTHPTIAIPEFMRMMVDEEGLPWDLAWEICTATFSYTNHTVLPEALERWPVPMLGSLLPRHLSIIFDINFRHLQVVSQTWPDNMDKLRSLSIIEEGEPKMIRMAHLAIVGSHTINGVAAIHSGILKERIFNDFFQLWPNKFQNKTNGITQRRWLDQSNQPLSALITKFLESDDWKSDLDLLTGLRLEADNPDLHAEWMEAKTAAKEKLAAFTLEKTGIEVNTAALFDVQIKRFHEYKRQLLNILYIIHRYRWITSLSKEQRASQVVPRVVFFGGKAAPAYWMAKNIIKLINAVAAVVNNDDSVGDLLKVVFLPNYNVSAAEVIIPATNLSQQISCAGMEASGTGNMKFALNGALIIGTMDGANIEIAEEIGKENMFIFGALANEVDGARAAKKLYPTEFVAVLDAVRDGAFGHCEAFDRILDSLTPENDYYLLGHDFLDYLRAQEEVDAAWRDQETWTKMSILSTAGSGKFSSDRTIRQYAKEIWNIKEASYQPNYAPPTPAAQAQAQAPAKKPIQYAQKQPVQQQYVPKQQSKMAAVNGDAPIANGGTPTVNGGGKKKKKNNKSKK